MSDLLLVGVIFMTFGTGYILGLENGEAKAINRENKHE